MLYEEKKVRNIKLILVVVYFLAIISFPISDAFIDVETIKAEVVSDDCYVDEYFGYTQESMCSLSLTFNVEVVNANVVVAFYDVAGNFLEEKEIFCSSSWNERDNCTVSSSFIYVNGEVYSYEIIDHDVTYEKYDSWDNFLETWNGASLGIILFSIIPPFSLIIINAFLISCKVYTYNGNEIIVYAGYYHKYMKVNGDKVDEYNSIIRFSDIHFSTFLNDGTTLDVRVNLMKCISLKINDKLYKEDERGENHNGQIF